MKHDAMLFEPVEQQQQSHELQQPSYALGEEMAKRKREKNCMVKIVWCVIYVLSAHKCVSVSKPFDNQVKLWQRACTMKKTLYTPREDEDRPYLYIIYIKYEAKNTVHGKASILYIKINQLGLCACMSAFLFEHGCFVVHCVWQTSVLRS